MWTPDALLSDPRSTGLLSVARKCDTSVRNSRSEILPMPEREKSFVCLVHTRYSFSVTRRDCAWIGCLKALRAAPVPPRSLPVNVETHRVPGSRARPSPRSSVEKNHPPGIPLSLYLPGSCRQFIHLLAVVLFLDYFQEKKNLEVDFWIEGGKSRVQLFTTASLYHQLSIRGSTNRFIVTHFLKS